MYVQTPNIWYIYIVFVYKVHNTHALHCAHSVRWRLFNVDVTVWGWTFAIIYRQSSLYLWFAVNNYFIIQQSAVQFPDLLSIAKSRFLVSVRVRFMFIHKPTAIKLVAETISYEQHTIFWVYFCHIIRMMWMKMNAFLEKTLYRNHKRLHCFYLWHFRLFFKHFMLIEVQPFCYKFRYNCYLLHNYISHLFQLNSIH